jgi:hypothetical protein
MSHDDSIAFATCQCGRLVLTHVWMNGTKHDPGHWRSLPEPLNPVEGPHNCPNEEKRDAPAV